MSVVMSVVKERWGESKQVRQKMMKGATVDDYH